MSSSPDELPEDAIALAHQLFDAARSGDRDAVLSAIDQGVPVDLATANGDTFIMLAAYNGHVALVRDLITHGAMIDGVNDRGQTPLAGAVFKQHDEVVHALISAGADPDAGQPTPRATAKMFGAHYFETP